jgi:Xaa-Pro aminopeptidase
MHSMMYFPAEEYQDRVARARALMAEQGIDALVATAPNNITYISGYRTNLFDSNFRPYFAIIPRDGDAVLLLPSLEKGVGQETSWIEDQRCWGPNKGDIAPDGYSAIAQVLESVGLSNGKLGIELGFGQRIGMHHNAFLDLQSSLPEIEWADATPIFWKLRGVKSDLEVANLRKAAEITDAAYETVLSRAAAGMPEREIQSILGQEYMRLGSDYRGFIIVTAGKSRYKMMNPYASDNRLQRGDMVILDFGAVFDGYWCDLTRAFFVGEASSRQREFYEVAKEASAAGMRAAKPGVPCEDIDAVCEKYLVDAGYREHMLHRTGHSIGLEVHELPSIGLGEKTPLQKNMVVAIEPGIYDFEIGGFRMEDIVLVTETGSEYLSNCTRDLTVV